MEENKQLKAQQAQMGHDYGASYGAEFAARVESQLEGSKIALQKAMEEGETDKIAEAQSILAAASADKVALEQYKQQMQQYNQQMEQYHAQQQAYAEQQAYAQQAQQQMPAQPAYNPPSSRAQKWANDNAWFGQDQVMTNVALAVHNELEKEGFDTESDDYYSEINKRMQRELPNRFKNVEAGGKIVQTVASPSRGNSNGRRKNRNQVELTPSEQQLAKRLGVSFKDYAIHKARLDNS
jgi:type II secretory pathway pseudopilin PulG